MVVLTKTLLALASIFSLAFARPQATTSTTAASKRQTVSSSSSRTISTTTTSTKRTTHTTSSTTSCTTWISTTINFDALPTGAPPPAGYGFANWNGGWNVTAGTPLYLNPTSGTNVVTIPAFLGWWGTAPSAPTGDFYLLSFNFACVAPQSSTNNFLVSTMCQIQLFTTTTGIGTGNGNYGTWDYMSNDYPGAPLTVQNMTHVTMDGGSYGTNWYFVATHGVNGMYIVLDDVVIEHYNFCP